MYWPSPQDYSEAVQTPKSSFDDPELRGGNPEVTTLGLPRCMSGNFASVFCFQCEKRKVAVRCFLHNIPDQQARYSAISKFVLSDDLPCTVSFEYLEKGINIHGDWYPILKMDWVEGITLREYVSRNLRNSAALNVFSSYFKEMTLQLRRDGIAHGDLQHDNILISEDELRLVDYDGMYVPGLSGQKANELGHPNYQHPRRSESFFNGEIDNFSAWAIYAAIKSLSIDPELFQLSNSGDDCILFRRSDYAAPRDSKIFQEMEAHQNPAIVKFGRALRYFLNGDLSIIPPLSANLAELPLESMALPVLPTTLRSTSERMKHSEWDDLEKTFGTSVSVTVREESIRIVPPKLVADATESTPPVTTRPPVELSQPVMISRFEISTDRTGVPKIAELKFSIRQILKQNENLIWDAKALQSVGEGARLSWLICCVLFIVMSFIALAGAASEIYAKAMAVAGILSFLLSITRIDRRFVGYVLTNERFILIWQDLHMGSASLANRRTVACSIPLAAISTAEVDSKNVCRVNMTLPRFDIPKVARGGVLKLMMKDTDAQQLIRKLTDAKLAQFDQHKNSQP